MNLVLTKQPFINMQKILCIYKIVSFVLVVTLFQCTVVRADDTVKFSAEQKNFVDKIKPAIEEDLSRVRVRSQKETKLQREVQVRTLLSRPDSSPDECASQVVRLIRESYASEQGIKRPFYLKLSSGANAGDLAFLLYLFKGRTDGLYEYTRLSGLYAQSVDMLWEDGMKWKSDDISEYQIYVLTDYLNAANIFYYVEATDWYDNLNGMIGRVIESNPQNESVQRFVLNYPFERNSYLSVAFRSNPSEAEQELYNPIEWLLDIFNKGVKTPGHRLAFINNTRRNFGVRALQPVLKSFIDESSPKTVPVDIATPAFKIAVHENLPVLAQEMIAKFPEQKDTREKILMKPQTSISSEEMAPPASKFAEEIEEEEVQLANDLNIPNVGQVAPDFAIQDIDGVTHHLSDLRGKKNLLLTFFPKCFTGDCRTHLASLRDQYADLQATDTEVLAVSIYPADGDGGQKAFAKQLNLPYPLIPDTDRKLSLLYGAVTRPTDFDRRMTILIDKQGVVRFVDTDVNVVTHGADILAKIKKLVLNK